MKKKNLKLVLGTAVLTFMTSILLLSCIGCGGIQKSDSRKTPKMLYEATVKDTSILELVLEDDCILLKSKNGKIILKDSLWKINPFFDLLKLNTNSFDKDLGLYYIEEVNTKDKVKSIFSKKKFSEIPDNYSSNYVNISTPALTSNGKDKFAASFLIEWGNGLLNENSIGEFQSSKIYIWNDKGILLETLNFDFGAAPYLTKNGNYIWLKYGQFKLNSTTQEFDITPCISLFDIEQNKIVFERKFSNQDLIVGGYNNTTKYFGFTTNRGKNNYTIYYFDDNESILYSKNFTSETNIDNITIEDNFDKIKLQ